MDRLRLKKNIQHYIKNNIAHSELFPKLCLDDNTLFHIKKQKYKSHPKCPMGCFLKNTLGSGSSNGEAYVSCKKKYCVALKQIPFNTDMTLIKNFTEEYARSNEIWIEFISMNLCNILIDNNVCPNLPILYSSFVCDSCSYTTEKLQDGKKCLILANEFAEYGDCKSFFENKHFKFFAKKYGNEVVLQNIIFQVCAGIYSLQKYFNLTHHDLHYGNILFVKQKQGGFSKYTIDSVDYYLPNLGFTVTLWDFGFALIPKKLCRSDTFYAKYITRYTNTHPAYINLPRLNVDSRRIISDILSFYNQFTYDKTTVTKYSSLIDLYVGNIFKYELFDNLTEKHKKITHSYNMDKSINIDNELSFYFDTNKDIYTHIESYLKEYEIFQTGIAPVHFRDERYNDYKIHPIETRQISTTYHIKDKSQTKTKICPPGKVINPKTNRCIKDKSQTQTKTTICPPGKVINPKTNRCIKDKSQTQKKTICPPGKVINPKTNRCIKDKSQTQKKTKTCPPGKVINPKTNRCIKDKSQTQKK